MIPQKEVACLAALRSRGNKEAKEHGASGVLRLVLFAVCFFAVDCWSPKMSDLSIEVASSADREWCARLMSSSEPWVILGQDFASCLASCNRPELEVLVARRAGTPCGLMILHPTGVAGSPYIKSIATVPEVREQGVGSALLDAAEQWFPKARHIFLCVSSFNRRARKFYERHGYAKVGEFPDYVIEGASEILMHKPLVRR
jgi:[ribosomal protein S18]-alanine N-acetyltransferase